jgi:hypothetical protein
VFLKLFISGTECTVEWKKEGKKERGNRRGGIGEGKRERKNGREKTERSESTLLNSTK